MIGTKGTIAVSFGTAGALIQEAGFATGVCGPGSIDWAHQPKKFIEFAQVEGCTALPRKLGDWAEG